MFGFPPGFLEGLGAAASLGTADFTSRYNSARFGSFVAVFFAITLGSLPFLIFHEWGHVTEWSSSAVLFSILAGVLNPISLWLLFRAIAVGPVAVVSPIIAANPALVVVINGLWGYIPSLVQSFGLMAIFAGVLLASGVYQGVRVLLQQNIAPKTIWLATFASILFAIRLIFIEFSVADMPVMDSFIISRCASALICIAVVLSFSDMRRHVLKATQVGTWPLLTLHATLEACGVFLIFWGTMGEGKTLLPVVFSTITLFTLLWARLFLKEKIPPKRLVGVAFVVFGVAVLAAAPLLSP